MTQQVPNFVVDEAEAQSSFVDTLKVTGRVTGITIEPSQRALSRGRNSGKKQSWAVFKLDNVSELQLEDGTTPNANNGWSVRYPYSFWDDVRGISEPPFKDNRQWFDAVVPKFAEVGLQLGGREANTADVIGCVVSFEQKTIEMPFMVAQRDENDNIVWEKEPSSEDADDGVPVKVPGQYTNVFPVSIEGLEFDPQEAYDRAAELYKKHDGNTGAFIAESIDDEVIGKVRKLKRKIQAGGYDPESDRNA